MKREDIEAVSELCPMQQGMLFHTLDAPSAGTYVSQLCAVLRGTVHNDAFDAAWQAVIRRHDILRTSFHWERVDKPVQMVHRAAPFSVRREDWRALNPAAQAEALQAYLSDDRAAGFHLSKPPLMRVALLRLEDERYQLVWSNHHILWDAWSRILLMQELLLVYQALCKEHTVALTPPTQYRDYIRWLQGRDAKEAERFWRAAVGDIEEPVRLELERPEQPRGGYAECARELVFSEELRSFARSQQITLNTLAQAGWALLLARYTGLREIVFGVASSGRPPELKGVDTMIGLFINTLPLRVRIDPGASTVDLLREIQQRSLEIRHHDHCSLAEVQSWCTALRGEALFDTILVFENNPASDQIAAWRGTFNVTNLFSVERTNYPLTIIVEPGSRIRVRAVYDSERFSSRQVEQILCHYEGLLDRITSRPRAMLCEQAAMDPAERGLALHWRPRETRAVTRFAAVHRLFEEQAQRTPESPAVRGNGRQWTYRELDSRANQWANWLRRRGIGPERLVGLDLERSPEMIAILLGIFKAGGAYLPLDADSPVERLRSIVEEAKLCLLLTSYDRTTQPLGIDAIALARVEAAVAAESTARPEVATNPDQLAYVLYTSGSTGRPKGVMISHAALVNYIQWMVAHFSPLPGEVVLQKTPLTFDVSGAELYPPLVSGGCLALAPPDAHRDPEQLAELLVRERVSTLHLVPSQLDLLLRQPRFGETSALARVISAGELLPADLATRFHKFSRAELHNAYGPTETTIYSTAWRCQEGAPTISIGTPIANTDLYVLNPDMQPVPYGVAGELYIGGAGLARGYLGQAAKTAERFLPHPFSPQPGERLYRAGDLVRLRSDATLAFVGRADHQIKLRGVRIELDEIQAVLSSHPGIREAAVVAHPGTGGALLAAYVATDAPVPLDGGDLRTWLSARLPATMIPWRWVRLTSLPRLPSGKLNRRELPLPSGPEAGHVEQPRTAIEQALVGIWSETLRTESFGIHDNFFALGGHSLIAVQVVSRIRRTFGVEMALRDLFERPTIAGIAAGIERRLCTSADVNAPTLRKSEGDAPAPLSFAQQRIWMLWQLASGKAAYHLPVFLRLRGVLDRSALTRSLREIVRRHEILRTVFPASDGVPVQRVLDCPEGVLTTVDLTQTPPDARQEEWAQASRDFVLAPFDLEHDLPFRVRLWKLDSEEYVAGLVLHHIAADGWSIGVLIREWNALYSAFAAGGGSPLAPLPIQYADYARWQRNWLSGPNLDRQLNYWTDRMTGAPPALALPCDRSGGGGELEQQERLLLRPAQTSSLREFSHRNGATLFMSLLAAYQMLLNRYTGEGDLCVGTPIAGRTRVEAEGLVGMFVNTLVLRAEVAVDSTPRTLLRQARETILSAYAHQEAPFEELVARIGQGRKLDEAPLFQTLFVFQSLPFRETLEMAGLRVELMEVPSGPAKFPLTCEWVQGPDGLTCCFRYDANRFTSARIRQLLDHYGRLLDWMVRRPDAPLHEFSMLDGPARQALLANPNRTARDFGPPLGLHELFEAQAVRTPDRTAVRFEDSQWTYAELDSRANQWSRWFARSGAAVEKIVAVALERSPEMVAVLLGTLKAGAAYLPVDPDAPVHRTAQILAQAKPAVVVTAQSLPNIANESPAPLNLPIDPSQVAYVLYTSGSTGCPKGVMIPHRAIVNHMRWMVEEFPFTPGDAVLQKTPFTFDASVWEFYAPLITGACLVFAQPGSHRDPAELTATIQREQITVLQLVPSQLRMLIEEPAFAGCLSLTRIFCGGEALAADLVHRLCSILPGIEVWNLYGPTEATIDATFGRCRPPILLPAAPLGRPIANTGIYVLDERMEPVPPGITGELYIGGSGLARGYLADPSQTAANFLPHPFSQAKGARLYRTGDHVRWTGENELEYLGRTDRQTKIRGMRIEVGEIEATLLQHPQIREAAVSVRINQGEPALAAFIATTVESVPLGLRDWLRTRLPEHMVPSRWTRLESLPRLASGKLDRHALRTASLAEDNPRQSRKAPRDTFESAVLRLFEEALGRHDLAMDDDFFAMGGHSLLAVRLFAAIRREFGGAPPLTEIFRIPTAEHLAAVIRGGLEVTPSSIVPLRAGAAGKPLFLIHPIGGSVVCYRDLARHLDGDYPIFGVEAPTRSGTPTIEEIATEYAQEIRRVQPDGPYLVAGWSMGGLIALEVCRTLTNRRGADALPLLLDSFLSKERPADEDPLRAVGGLAYHFGYRKALSPREADDLVRLDERGRAFALLAVLRGEGLIPQTTTGAEMEALLRTFSAHQQAFYRYAPSTFSGPVHLFLTGDGDDEARKWAEVLSRATVHRAPGDHFSLLDAEHAPALAAMLNSVVRNRRASAAVMSSIP